VLKQSTNKTESSNEDEWVCSANEDLRRMPT